MARLDRAAARRRRLLPLGLLVLLLTVVATSLAPGRARAEPPGPRATPLVVLDIDSEDAEDQAEALTSALRSRVRSAAGWSLVEPSSSSGTQALGTLIVALKCPAKPDATCLQRIGDQLHVDRFIWGQMTKAPGNQVAVDLHLWTRGKSDSGMRETYTDNLKDPSDETLRKVAARLFAKVMGMPLTGTVIVHAGTGAGTVVVDGADKGALENGVARVEVPSGAHSVDVKVSGFTSTAQQVNVNPGIESDVTIALTAAKVEPPPPPSKPLPVKRIVGISALVVGGGFLVAGGIQGARFLSLKSDLDDRRARVPSSIQDVCQDQISVDAQEACNNYNDAKKARTLGLVFAGVGAVLAAGGAFLLLTDKDTDAKSGRIRVNPYVGAGGSGVDLALTF